MIDTHAHLDFPDFQNDREEVILRAFDNGVKKIVNIGVDLETSKKSIELAVKYENIFASVGLHPGFFSFAEKEFSIFNFQFSNNSKINKLINELKKLAKNKKVVAIGEIGLDYFSHNNISITDKQKENQKKGFLAQIELARDLGLPVIVHCRNAWKDLFGIISKVRLSPSSKQVAGIPQSRTFFVLHCYSGEREDTEKFLKLDNIYFSFAGNITYPKPAEQVNNFAEVIKMIPLNRIMLDSDSPFLAPQAMRGKRNEPANVRFIAEKIAEIKEISGEEVERVTDENASNFFGI
jgi:TatD DNase family protein